MKFSEECKHFYNRNTFEIWCVNFPNSSAKFGIYFGALSIPPFTSLVSMVLSRFEKLDLWKLTSKWTEPYSRNGIALKLQWWCGLAMDGGMERTLLKGNFYWATCQFSMESNKLGNTVQIIERKLKFAKWNCVPFRGRNVLPAIVNDGPRFYDSPPNKQLIEITIPWKNFTPPTMPGFFLRCDGTTWWWCKSGKFIYFPRQSFSF